MRYLLIILLLAIISACSCKKDTFKDDELSLKKQPYNGNQLRIDGYYYNEYGAENKATVYFLYQNGILINAGVIDINEMNYFESIINTELIDKIKTRKHCYGLFAIESTKIKLEHWTAGFSHQAYMEEGKILNDSTFQITTTYCSNGSNKENVDWVYHFKQFSPKPDSTNQFIP